MADGPAQTLSHGDLHLLACRSQVDQWVGKVRVDEVFHQRIDGSAPKGVLPRAVVGDGALLRVGDR